METNIKIDGITCAGCLNRIDASLRSLGVFRFDYDFYLKEALVIYDEDNLHLSDILDEINHLGYEANKK